MKKVIIIIIIIALVALLITVLLPKETSTNLAAREPIDITPENLPAALLRYEIINDLPNEASIYLQIGDLSYYVTKDEITREIPDQFDIKITLPEFYLDAVGNNPCEATKLATQNGHLSYDLKISKTKMLLKYNKMLQYKGCLG